MEGGQENLGEKLYCSVVCSVSLSFLEDYAEGIKTRIEKRMACTFSLIKKRRFFRLRDFLEPRENRFQGILLINSSLLTKELFLVACFILDK